MSTIGLQRGGTAGKGRRRGIAAVGTNVLALGAVSLVTDISSEMVTAVLPLYFVLTLQMSPAVYGVVDGLYTGATALLRLVGGYVADRARRRKAVAGIGYGVSAAAKLGLLAAGGSVPAIGAVIVADRAGKGLRTAPRDALITLSAPDAGLGRAFGLHRAMDSVGAFAGPLVALGVLALVGAQSPGAFDAVFVTSFCVAAAAVVILVLFVRDRREARPPAHCVSPAAAFALLRDARVRALLAAACLLGLATIGDGFVYLLLMRREEFGTGWFPLLAVGANLSYLLLAAPFGTLADRFGRLPVVLGGYGGLLAVYLLLFCPLSGAAITILTLALYGGFYAATDGVLMALAAPVLPKALRTTGIALIQTGQALAYFASSVGFGLAWHSWGPAAATRMAAGAVLLAVALTAVLLVRPTASGEGARA
ncbi:MFS transporter [Wenjunlia tyrosinilytica]|uniref:MFS transporter n=1 Tax=Wenjunlia tyrosinilytica TaxID=1544741 RepID=A0A918DY05_9ACTN|nr:MFS transporter [Wenjunlia tyrosinilytica]GGO90542.1 MFS transporter [Wenjunlia tyrosinilytica]